MVKVFVLGYLMRINNKHGHEFAIQNIVSKRLVPANAHTMLRYVDKGLVDPEPATAIDDVAVVAAVVVVELEPGPPVAVTRPMSSCEALDVDVANGPRAPPVGVPLAVSSPASSDPVGRAVESVMVDVSPAPPVVLSALLPPVVATELTVVVSTGVM